MQNDLNSIAEQLLTQQQKYWNILLIGDSAIDIYKYGNINRLSPEAPVPVFVPTYEETRYGMAKNVANNLKNLNCRVTNKFGQDNIKTRFLDSKSKQHLIRVDNDVEQSEFSDFEVVTDKFNAVVISDYDKGFVTYEVIDKICNQYNGPIFIDTKKKDLARFDYSNVFIKINNAEYESSTSKSNNIITTLGKEGAFYKGSIYPTPDIEVADVCGAGDTFLAALTVEYLRTNSIDQAIHFANMASSVTVRHIGTYAPTLEEINAVSGIR